MVPMGDSHNSSYHSIGGLSSLSLLFPMSLAPSTELLVHRVWAESGEPGDAVVKSLFSEIRLLGLRSRFYY